MPRESARTGYSCVRVALCVAHVPPRHQRQRLLRTRTIGRLSLWPFSLSEAFSGPLAEERRTSQMKEQVLPLRTRMDGGFGHFCAASALALSDARPFGAARGVNVQTVAVAGPPLLLLPSGTLGWRTNRTNPKPDPAGVSGVCGEKLPLQGHDSATFCLHSWRRRPLDSRLTKPTGGQGATVAFL